MSGEYETKNKIFKRGAYLKVYESKERGWCWLARLTNYNGTFIEKGFYYKTRIDAEKAMMRFVEKLEPMIYHYKKTNCDCDQNFYKTYISHTTSYTMKVCGLEKFAIYLRFLWCRLFHKKHKFRFHQSVEPFIKCGNDIYYNIYCNKCWCIQQRKLNR